MSGINVTQSQHLQKEHCEGFLEALASTPTGLENIGEGDLVEGIGCGEGTAERTCFLEAGFP